MVHLLRKLLLTVALSTTLNAASYNFEVDGINYKITDSSNNTVCVTSNDGSNSYSGSVVIPDLVEYFRKKYSVTAIGSRAFSQCRTLTSITIPNSVTSIGASAFYYCIGLTSVTIPNSVTSIESSAFNSCSGLKSVTISNSVTSIESSAFAYCSGLKSVTIPNSVTSIGSTAFASCSGLTSVTIPNSVTSIGNSAFASCSGLTSVTIPNSVTSIESSAFAYCGSIASIFIGNSVIKIGDEAFKSCSNLKSIEIPTSVKEIGTCGFSYCRNINQVKIKSSDLILGDSCFEGCTEIIKIESYAETPPECYYKALASVNKSLCKLYVPKGCAEKYREAYQWMEFENIYETLDPISGIDEPKIDKEDNIVDVFDAAGICIKYQVHTSELKQILKPGLYIIRSLDGKAKQVIIK